MIRQQQSLIASRMESTLPDANTTPLGRPVVSCRAVWIDYKSAVQLSSVAERMCSSDAFVLFVPVARVKARIPRHRHQHPREEIARVGRKEVGVSGESMSVSWNAALTRGRAAMWRIERADFLQRLCRSRVKEKGTPTNTFTPSKSTPFDR